MLTINCFGGVMDTSSESGNHEDEDFLFFWKTNSNSYSSQKMKQNNSTELSGSPDPKQIFLDPLLVISFLGGPRCPWRPKIMPAGPRLESVVAGGFRLEGVGTEQLLGFNIFRAISNIKDGGLWLKIVKTSKLQVEGY